MSRALLGIALLLCAVSIPSVAGQPPVAPPPRLIPIGELVKQLGSQDFAEREAAKKRLYAMAVDPPPELLAATKSANPELRDRATNAAQAMRINLVLNQLPRGQQFAKRGQVDLFVAATAVWNLKPNDPRLWVDAQDLGRRLIEKAEMTGDRKPHNCPSSFKDFATYKKLCNPRFTRVDDVYEKPPNMLGGELPGNTPEAIQAPDVKAPFGFVYNLVIVRGSVEAKTAIQASVVLANGNVKGRNGFMSSVIVCDGDVSVTDSHIWRTLVVARGNITVKKSVDSGVLVAGGKVTVGEKYKGPAANYSVIKENEANPLGITFFELATVGVETKVVDKAVQVTAIAAGKPFASAGARVGDIVAEVNGQKPDSPEGLRRLLRDALAVGDATLKLQRGDKTETVKVTLPE